jgi:hypothetical protein
MAMFYFPTVDIGRIEEVDAQFKGAIHDLVAIFFGCMPPKIHRAQAKIAYKYTMPA